jgi:hypothetical protein
MKIKKITQIGSWTDVMNVARATVGKKPLEKEPSDAFKYKMLYTEHSPLREISFRIEMEDIKYWVSMHLRTHNQFARHFVRSQRTDKTGIDRDDLKQSALVDHTITMNYQSIITTSRDRHCQKASRETREVWERIVCSIYSVDKPLGRVCVPECVYRGVCPYGADTCGLYNSGSGLSIRNDYVKNIYRGGE